MSKDHAELSIRDFRNAVRKLVVRYCAGELAQLEIDMDGAEYKRGVLTVRIDEHYGAAHVTYVALPTAVFGHSSGAGLPHRLTFGNVEAAANEVAARLQDRFLYRID